MPGLQYYLGMSFHMGIKPPKAKKIMLFLVVMVLAKIRVGDQENV